MKPELFAPAGSPASLRAAVEAGADSVYMGSIWNARVRARNFSQPELASAISYCRKSGVKAYVALNTLIFEKELPLVAEYISFVYEHGADALIVQDLGVAEMAREIAPGLPLHASTQLSAHNSKAASLLKKLGFSRLILARELTLEQAKKIREKSGAEVEAFCHGALCYSYSGKCFFSLAQTGRSANRGACAQMCRFPWKLYRSGKYVKSGYLTSTKDLNAISLMPEMAKAGIACVKIEGRLKDATYVKGVVSAYRRAIDSGETPDLSGFTSRGYTQGYLSNSARKEKLTSPGAPSFSGECVGKVVRVGRDGAKIKLASSLKAGDSIRASSSGKIIEVFRIYVQGKEVPSADGECTLRIRTIRQGDTLYKVARAQIEDDFLKDYPPQKMASAKQYAPESSPLQFAPLPRLAYLEGNEQLRGSAQGAFVVPIERFSAELAPHAAKLVIDTPRVAFDSELPALERRIREISDAKPLAFMASEPSLVCGYGTILSPYANATNTLAARAWQNFGNIRGAAASLEIAKAEAENASLGFAAYSGYPVELMISENDLLSELGIGGNCELEDPRGNRFAITKSGARTVILKKK
ncbi:Peptidase family U32 [uncultured archaeon]|nr:Peptidase family U32 [uncultured archaeon]